MSFPKRLIITGANGFVAGSVISQADARHGGTRSGASPISWEVHAVSRGAAASERPGWYWYALSDSCDAARLRRLFQDVRPHAVIHTAAIADIDYCEAHQDLARAVNVDLTQTVADLCRDVGAKLVHCSTDTVFDGERAPYREEDAPGPVNYYAQTKVEAENIAAKLGHRAVIARLSLVMGLPVLGSGNSFLSKMVKALKEGREVGVPQNEIRSPIDVITLGQALLELADGGLHGFVHLAGNDVMNRYDMMQRIAAQMGFPRHLIVANDPSGIPGRAPRPRDVSLDNRKARATLKTPMCGLEEGLTKVLPAERLQLS